jgi:ribosome maturation factor RimP
MIRDRIIALAEEKLTGTSIFLVDVIVREGGNKIEVYIDGDVGVTIDDIAGLSRFLGKYLDEEDLIENAYTLEVSSPGLSRPLKLLRQYKKNVGRKLEVTTTDEHEVNGTLIYLDDDKCILQIQLPKTEPVDEEIYFNKIKETKVKI